MGIKLSDELETWDVKDTLGYPQIEWASWTWLKQQIAQLEEENARLRTYALFMESGRESAGVQRYRVALGLEDMAAWIVPDKHRALLTEKPE